MPKKKKKRRRNKTVGLPPGSLVYTGDQNSQTGTLMLYKYNEQDYKATKNVKVDTLPEKMDSGSQYWLQVIGLNQAEIIQKIGNVFQIDQLALEDILDVSQRPKCNVFKDYLFFTLKMLFKDEEAPIGTNYQQISIILKEKLIITFQEKEDNGLKNLTDRLAKNDTLLRTKSIDYLFYRLLDTVVDYYYVEIDNLEDRIEDLELNLKEEAQDDDLQRIQTLRRSLIVLRRNVYPLREAISAARKEDVFFSETTIHYLSDVYDHTIHVVETIENYRDLTSGLMDLYMTGISNRMNEIMKVLTIIATIFIPLTFIAGVYGMNFKYMPELDYKWAYPASLLFMLIVAGCMVLYFRRKKWL